MFIYNYIRDWYTYASHYMYIYIMTENYPLVIWNDQPDVSPCYLTWCSLVLEFAMSTRVY